MKKIKGSYVVGAIIAIGLIIYFFSKRKVSGSVTALESEAEITYNRNVDGRTMVPGAEQGTVDFGTEGM
jgi:hypothetical protein